MKTTPKWLPLAMSTALLAATTAKAATDVWFTPLTHSAPVVAPNMLPELIFKYNILLDW